MNMILQCAKNMSQMVIKEIFDRYDEVAKCLSQGDVTKFIKEYWPMKRYYVFARRGGYCGLMTLTGETKMCDDGTFITQMHGFDHLKERFFKTSDYVFVREDQWSAGDLNHWTAYLTTMNKLDDLAGKVKALKDNIKKGGKK